MGLMRNIFWKILWACCFFSPSGCHTSQIYASLSPSCGEKSSLQFAFIDESFIKYIQKTCCAADKSFVKCILKSFALYEAGNEYNIKYRISCASHYDTIQRSHINIQSPNLLLSLDLYNLVFFSSLYDLCMLTQKLKYETNTEHTGKSIFKDVYR